MRDEIADLATVKQVVETLAQPRPLQPGEGPLAAGGVAFAPPSSVGAPPGAEGWQDLYSYSLRFGGARRQAEDAEFWFRESLHWPRPVAPFDATVLQWSLTSLAQYNSRHFFTPAAMGVDCRILNGYCYVSAVRITDPDVIEARKGPFVERAGHYYAHWDEIYLDWMVKVRDVIRRFEAVSFPELPDAIDLDEVRAARGVCRPHGLVAAYHTLLDLGMELWQLHFQLLNLGYAAYLDFFEFCSDVFPGIDDLAIAKMVAGIDVDLFRPDRELRRLARLAVELDLDAALGMGAPEVVFASLGTSARGRQWLAEWDRVRDPWFNYSSGSGFSHADQVWADHPSIPLDFVRGYVRRLREGHDIETPVAAVADERDRITDEHAARLDGSDLATFLAKVDLARKVFHYVENHNFYVEHWGMSLFWRKMRELSAVFVDHDFWDHVDDVFMLRREEVDDALLDMTAGWACGSAAAGVSHWRPEIARRRAILDACAAWTPPPALGVAPETISEPFTIMLWGVTSSAIAEWLNDSTAEAGRAGRELVGFAASPGIAVGRARVVESVDEIGDVEDGEILVARLTSPSWAPVFSRIAATITVNGGMMSHVAIVCREYGLPAVTGVTSATQVIRTGQIVCVDGNLGRVTVVG